MELDIDKIKKRLFGAIYVLDKDKAPSRGRPYFDASSGIWVPPQEAKGGTVIEVVHPGSTKNYAIFDRQPSKKYVYRSSSEDGVRYYGSDRLTTDFIRDALQDHYGTPAVVIRDSKVVIAFYGSTGQKIIYAPDSERSANRELESMFQGVDYKVISWDEARKIIAPGNAKKIALLVAVAAFGAMTLFYPEEESQVVAPAQPVEVIKKQEQEKKRMEAIRKRIQEMTSDMMGIVTTQIALRELLTVRSTPVSFVGDASFHGARSQADVFFLYPDQDTTERRGFYVRKVGLVPDGFDHYRAVGFTLVTKDEVKPYSKCRKIMSEAGEVKKTSGPKTTFSVSGQMEVGELWSFLKSIYGCPLSIRGQVKYSRSPYVRNVRMTVDLYDVSKMNN